jgi:hypothetical protein
MIIVMASCSSDTPEDTIQIDELSEIGDCLGPDSEDPSGFVPEDCEDPAATVEILAMELMAGSEPECPPGTDVLIEAQQGSVFEGTIMGLPETWCLRNLEPPHPGDLGMGGGQLLAGDCFYVSAGNEIVEVACDGRGTATPENRLLAVVESTAECPPETTDPIELSSLFPPEVLCSVAL